MSALHQVQVILLGSDEDLARRLEQCYASIAWEIGYRIDPQFSCHPKESWRRALPAGERGLVFLEINEGDPALDSQLLNDIRAHNPRLQLALLADEAVDYFQVARDFRIGNILKKNRFDTSMVRALSIRLLTGNIFGFEPYFPNGFTAGPLFKTYAGKVVVEEVIRECFDFCSPHVHPDEVSGFRIFLHELLINTFAYAIEEISPEDRDSKFLRPPPEVDIPERKAIKVSLAVDNEKVGLSVMDSTGNLSMLRVLEKLRRQSRIGGEKMPPGIWDETGRGISLVYRYSRLIVNILQGVRTETVFLQYNEKDLNRFESIIITEVTPF